MTCSGARSSFGEHKRDGSSYSPRNGGLPFYGRTYTENSVTGSIQSPSLVIGPNGTSIARSILV